MVNQLYTSRWTVELSSGEVGYVAILTIHITNFTNIYVTICVFEVLSDLKSMYKVCPRTHFFLYIRS